jgi:hypothetical protein
MKALSIRQPWAWAILCAGKRIENRSWQGCGYRGPILLHASKGCTRDEFEDAAYAIGEATGGGLTRRHVDFVRYEELQRGGIVGRARVDGVIRTEADFAAYAASARGSEEQRAWWAGGFALVLADVEPLPFVAWKGELGLFEVPEERLWKGP